MSTKTGTFKYAEIARTLQGEIESGRWPSGQRLPGEMLLARRFNVAHMTIRQAIDSLIDERMLVRVPAKGTFVLSGSENGPRVRTCRPMALLFPADAPQIDPYYFPELLVGFQQAMDDAGHAFSLISYETAESSRKLDPSTALACLLIEPSHVGLAERLRENRFPVVAINHHTGRRSIPSVYVDDARGVEQAVDHLVALGHKSIGFLKGTPGNLDGEERLHGFRAATQRHGLTDVVEIGGGYREPHGYQVAVELLASRRHPSALICASDLAAIGAIRAARERGLSVPGDLSVVGFGDFSVADYVMPRLTTIRQPRTALGAAAANALIQLANGLDTPGNILIPDLIIRDSASSTAGR